MDKDIVRRFVTFFADAFCIGVGILLSRAFTHGIIRFGGHILPFGSFLALQLLMLALIEILFRSYGEPIDGNLVSSLAGILADYLISLALTALIFSIAFSGMPDFPFLLNDVLYTIAFVCIFRLLVIVYRRLRMLLSHRNGTGDAVRVIIFGAGDAGRYLADMLRKEKGKNLIPVAFIDDDPRLEGKRIRNLPVVGDRTLLPHTAKKYRATQVIIAIPFVDNSTIRDIFNLCCQANCTVRRFANMTTFTADALSKATINEVNVEDLLFRDAVRLDLQTVKDYIEGKTVLVTGGAGSIGSELCRQILSYNAKKVVILDISENMMFALNNELSAKYTASQYATCIGSVQDKERLREVFESYRPQVVFHAAAHKHVPMMELNPREALKNNILGTRNVAEAANEYRAERFILISTDKAVNPANIMGTTKRICELLIQHAGSWGGATKFSAVRFGNVLGSNGSVVPLFKKQIQSGGPITVTDRNIKRYFMTIPEAVQLVLETGALSKGGEIFVLDMGEPVRIYDLAVNMIRLSGLQLDKDIKIRITGLRPGEKLFEELNLSGEIVDKTSNNRIFVMKRRKEDGQIPFDDLYDRLCRSIRENDYSSAFQCMSLLVPTFSGEFSSYVKMP